MVLTAVFALSICGNAAGQDKKFTIVIDAGHGGKDPGAVRGRVLEKDLNLALALAFGKLINEGMPDVEVLYTRNTDKYVTLEGRGALANRAGADLFFSIHINANVASSPNGTSTFVMGVSKSEANLAEAMRENEVIKYEDGYTETYQGFDPSSAESYIIFNLMQYAHFDRSLALAKIVQKHYSKNSPMRDRGAAQGPYLVLWKAAMPSVLTEVGFISNEKDLKYITSQAGQAAIARSLYDAFREYKELVQSEGATARTGATTPAATNTASTQQKPASTTTQSKPVEQPEPAPAKKPVVPFEGAGFYVQLMATRTPLAADDARLTESGAKALEREADGWYRYYLGPFDALDEAVGQRDAVKRRSFPDAFVIALDGTKQIGIGDARRRIAAQNK